MIRSYSIACFLILVNLVEINFARQLGFLSRSNEINKRLETYIAEHHAGYEPKYEIKWFKQKLDHFTPNCTQTWKQQYAVKMDNYGGNEVVFLQLEGEWDMNTAWLDYGGSAEAAIKYKAAQFMIEHRFYGESRPKPDLSLDSLKYLSSKQALADIANFIPKMNARYKFSNPKWIVFGGSYAGSLAAWLRYKYPHLVYAAVSSSGVLLAKADFSEYFQMVTKSFAVLDTECVDVIKAINQEMRKDVADKITRADYREIFQLCDSLEDNEKDLATFFDSLAFNLGTVAQYNLDRNGVCVFITDDSEIKHPIERYGRMMRLLTDSFSKTSDCMDHKYSHMIQLLQNTEYAADGPWRQWMYQTCTEFGWYATSSSKNDTFGDKFPLQYFIDICTDVYGPRFNSSFVNKDIEETNSNYGGLSLAVERVIFLQGSLDPWSPLTIPLMLNPPEGSYAILIQGETHCADMMPKSWFDRAPLVRAKARKLQIIGNWINDKQ